MQIRSFRESGEPVWVNAPPSAGVRLGPDSRRALGPAATPAASTGRTRDRTRPMLHQIRKSLPGRRPHVTHMYGPAVRRKRFSSSWRQAVLHQCIRPLGGARWAPGHHGNQRACDLITGQASVGHLGHQCSQTPGRPILHLVSSSRRPRRVIRLRQRGLRLVLNDQAGWIAASATLLASKLRPWARTLQAMRASLLASAIASTLRCSRLLAASIQGLSP